jgi:hypothetical protein
MLVEKKAMILFASQRNAMLVKFVLADGFRQHTVPNGTVSLFFLPIANIPATSYINRQLSAEVGKENPIAW